MSPVEHMFATFYIVTQPVRPSNTESHTPLDTDTSAAIDTTTATTNTTTTTSSPSREVSPKYVVAGKKYGRRSRPASGAFEDMSSDSDSDSDRATASGHPTTAPRHQRTAAPNATAQKATQKVMIVVHRCPYTANVFARRMYSRLCRNAHCRVKVSESTQKYTCISCMSACVSQDTFAYHCRRYVWNWRMRVFVESISIVAASVIRAEGDGLASAR